MSRKYRSILASILTAAIVLGSATAVNAAQGSGQGNGSLDIVKYPDVFQVVLPTNVGGRFNYILDPTGILATNGADKYASSSFVAGKTMYFRHEPAAGSDIAIYDNISDPVTAYNKSNIDVEIRIQAKLNTPKGITLASASVAGDTSTVPKMYLALTEGTKPIAITAQGIVATASIPSAKDHYETIYDSRSATYKNVLNASASNASEEQYGTYFKSYSFMLTGDCNPSGDWAGLKDGLPAVSLVWAIDMKEGAAVGMPGISDGADGPDVPPVPGAPTVTISDDGIIWIEGLTGTQNYGNMVTLTYGGQTTQNLDSDLGIDWVGTGTDWTSANGGKLGIKLGTTWMNTVKGKLVIATVRLTDGTMITGSHQF